MDNSDNKEVTDNREVNECLNTEKETVNENEKFKDAEVGFLDDKKSYIKREIYSWIRSIGLVILLSFIFLKIFTNATIPSSSMEKTIMTHDRLFGYNFAYLASEPKRGDIVIFYMPDEPHEIYIKRIIGIENDTIDFQEVQNEDGESYVQVVLNGEPLEESYINEPMDDFTDLELHFKVPEDSVFLMGDNRNNSHDSRYWVNHYVRKDAIISKALFRYWPLNKMGVIR